MPNRSRLVLESYRKHTLPNRIEADSKPNRNCNQRLTVEHILLNCVEFMQIRENCYTSAALTERFSTVPPRTIVKFIKEIGFYKKNVMFNGVFFPYSPLQF